MLRISPSWTAEVEVKHSSIPPGESSISRQGRSSAQIVEGMKGSESELQFMVEPTSWVISVS